MMCLLLNLCLTLQESGLKANQPVSFAVQLNGAKGDLKAKVVPPSGPEEECTITEIDDGEFAASATTGYQHWQTSSKENQKLFYSPSVFPSTSNANYFHTCSLFI